MQILLYSYPHPIPILHGKPVPSPLQHSAQFPLPPIGSSSTPPALLQIFPLTLNLPLILILKDFNHCV